MKCKNHAKDKGNVEQVIGREGAGSDFLKSGRPLNLGLFVGGLACVNSDVLTVTRSFFGTQITINQ